MFNHNFIHQFQPRANGARAVVEAVDMDAFASALRGSFARGGRGGRGASTRFRSTRSDDCWRILLSRAPPGESRLVGRGALEDEARLRECGVVTIDRRRKGAR